MTVEQTDLIDVVRFHEKSGRLVLTISDHLDWSDSTRHQTILQKKFNAYLAFVEGGEVFERCPNARGRAVEFEVVFKFKPNAEGVRFLGRAKSVIESAGFTLRHEVFAESYDN